MAHFSFIFLNLFLTQIVYNSLIYIYILILFYNLSITQTIIFDLHTKTNNLQHFKAV
jgi:hypothetical protein